MALNVKSKNKRLWFVAWTLACVMVLGMAASGCGSSGTDESQGGENAEGPSIGDVKVDGVQKSAEDREDSRPGSRRAGANKPKTQPESTETPADAPEEPEAADEPAQPAAGGGIIGAPAETSATEAPPAAESAPKEEDRRGE